MQKKFKFMFLILSFILVLSLIVARDKKNIFDRNKQVLKNNYECQFYDTVNYLDDVKNLLKKVELAKIPRQNIIFFAQIWHSAAMAHNNLSGLPCNHELISRILKYLSQTSDFCYAMLNKSVENKNLSDNEWQKINDLKIYADDLSFEMNKILNEDCVAQKISWDKLILANENNDNEDKNKFDASMNDVKKKFQEYGELVYDGAFSDHVKNINTKMLINAKEINKFEATEKIKKIFESEYLNRMKKIKNSGEINKKNLSVYFFNVLDDDDQEFYFEITKKGGYLLLILGEPKEKNLENKLNIEDGIELAKKFLAENNFLDMHENYYEETEKYLTVNFMPIKNNIIYYSDLVKVKIDLYAKKIIGLEALGYLNMHCEREKNFFGIDMDLVKDLLPDEFEKNKINECVVPLENGKEVFCYEVTGIYKQEKFLIYINQESGKFEKIYRLIENQRGIIVE